MVDSTFTTPYLLRPFDHGADLLYHSATKFLGGHGIAIGGLLVDGGSFDWEASGKFPELTEPYDGFHGMDFQEESTVAAFCLRARREGLRDFGACMSAHDRLPDPAGHRDAAAAHGPARGEHAQGGRVAGEASGGGERVLPRTGRRIPTTRWRSACCRAAAARVFSFNIRGDRAAGRRFIETLQVFSHLANVGDAKSLVIHPASTTHFRMDEAALRGAGIAEGTMRLSIGLEDPQDLIDDLARGLRAAQKG